MNVRRISVMVLAALVVVVLAYSGLLFRTGRKSDNMRQDPPRSREPTRQVGTPAQPFPMRAGQRLLSYGQSLARGELDLFFVNNRTYRSELAEQESELSEDQWAEAESGLQKMYRDFLNRALSKDEWNERPFWFDFEKWAYRPDAGASVALIETRSDGNHGAAVFLRFTYMNPSHSPKWASEGEASRPVASVVIQFVVEDMDDGLRINVDHAGPVESSLIYHPRKELTR